jgi:ABC-type branched-subunit amino acid transport system substrate-binding protein
VKRTLSLTVALSLMAACGGGSSNASQQSLIVVVNAPFSKSPAIGQSIEQGVRLAVDEINAAGGVPSGGRSYTLRIEKLDNALSPRQALDNVRRAVAEHAVAIVDEGTGVDASSRIANDAHIPLCIVYQGGEGLVDPSSRPNVFRIAPTDHGMAFRLAEYLIPRGPTIALMHDDSDYGQQGDVALRDSFGHNPEAVAAQETLSAGASDVSPQVLQARQSGAGALVVWGLASTIVKVIRAARQSGWKVPLFTPASAEDPLLRQQLSDHPEWIDGLTFASGRMTAEVGPGPFLAFQKKYERAFGPFDTGVKTSRGETVVQPPDYAMSPYDFVKLLAAALAKSNGPTGTEILAQLNQVAIQGVNGDVRGFNSKNHDGVVDDDVYFAVFHDMTFTPVEDDPLSATLPVIDQTR